MSLLSIFTISQPRVKILTSFFIIGGVPIVEWVGLRAKAYSFLLQSKTQKLKKAAGVKRCVQSQLLHHRHYLKVLRSNSLQTVTQSTFISKKQRVYTVKQTKTGISALDIKRYVLDNGIETLPYGHFKTLE